MQKSYILDEEEMDCVKAYKDLLYLVYKCFDDETDFKYFILDKCQVSAPGGNNLENIDNLFHRSLCVATDF